MPSNVYGISTPGRSATKTAQVPSNPNATIFRTGGHSFVMDDGAAGDSVNPVGTDQLIRLRTTSGHQILMNDTENVLYVASASGDQWLEFSNDGQIHVYSTNAINMRTKGVMNFHADGAIIMNSPIIEMNAVDTSGGTGQSAIVMNTPGSIAMSAQTGISAQTNGSLGLSATMGSFNCLATLGLSSAGMTSVYGTLLKLNTGFPGIPNINLNSTPLNTLDDTVYSDGTNAWVKSPHTITSACTTVPAHEPWVGPDGKSRPAPQIPGQPAGSALGTLAVGAALAGLASTIGGALF
jgi:hypothetical protein